MTTTCRTARKRDLSDIRMGNQRLSDLLAVPRNHIDHTLGKSRFLNQFYKFQS